ncbi:3879_t:CDS:2, partial [Entrophospora sp. SA101]
MSCLCNVRDPGGSTAEVQGILVVIICLHWGAGPPHQQAAACTQLEKLSSALPDVLENPAI